MRADPRIPLYGVCIPVSGEAFVSGAGPADARPARSAKRGCMFAYSR